MYSAILLFVLNVAWAGCRDHVPTAPDVPECPENGGILNEGFPAQAALIGGYYAESGLVDGFARAVLESNQEKAPQLFIVAQGDEFESIKEKILAGAPKGQREKWSDSLTQVNGIDVRWMQDFMLSKVDPATGRNKISPIEPIGRIYGDPRIMGLAYSSVREAMGKDCDIGAGEALRDPSRGKDFAIRGLNPSGFGGGNLEGGPAGLCIVGEDHLLPETFDAYSTQACGRGRVLKAPTSWLHVGHADEIGTTVRFGPGPCDEAYLITSPRQALKVLRANPKDLAFPHLDKIETGSWIGQEVGDEECFALFDLLGGVLENTEPPKSTTEFRLLPAAHADFLAKIRTGGLTPDDMVKCGHMTNLQFAQIYQSLHGKYMETIQKELDQFANDLKAEWKKLRPECTPNVIEVPTLYRARSWPVGPEGKQRTITRGFPIHLPAVNSVQMGRSLLMPDPKNAAFQKEIRHQLDKLKLTARFFDTERANFEGGNLHCLTNTVRYCRPKANPK